MNSLLTLLQCRHQLWSQWKREGLTGTGIFNDDENIFSNYRHGDILPSVQQHEVARPAWATRAFVASAAWDESSCKCITKTTLHFSLNPEEKKKNESEGAQPWCAATKLLGGPCPLVTCPALRSTQSAHGDKKRARKLLGACYSYL